MYDENPIIARMREAHWSPDESGQRIWDSFLQDYVKMPAAQRREALRNVDSYLDTQTHVTRETASMIRQKRQLSDIHLALHRAGR
jgi:hypothetical protein